MLTAVPWPKTRFPGPEIEKLGVRMVKGNVALEVCVPEAPVMVTSVVPGMAVLPATSDKEEFPLLGFGEI